MNLNCFIGLLTSEVRSISAMSKQIRKLKASEIPSTDVGCLVKKALPRVRFLESLDNLCTCKLCFFKFNLGFEPRAAAVIFFFWRGRSPGSDGDSCKTYQTTLPLDRTSFITCMFSFAACCLGLLQVVF